MYSVPTAQPLFSFLFLGDCWRHIGLTNYSVVNQASASPNGSLSRSPLSLDAHFPPHDMGEHYPAAGGRGEVGKTETVDGCRGRRRSAGVPFLGSPPRFRAGVCLCGICMFPVGVHLSLSCSPITHLSLPYAVPHADDSLHLSVCASVEGDRRKGVDHHVRIGFREHPGRVRLSNIVSLLQNMQREGEKKK